MHIAKLVSRLFKPSIIEEIAKTSGFMKRHSKLLPETFAKAMTLGNLDIKNITEEVIAEKCAAIQNGISLSKQAISARLQDSELYRIRWQIELLFKVLKSTFSIDKMHVAKTKYIESILYGRLIGILMTMPLYDCIDQTLLSSKGRDVSIQRFYTLFNVDLYQFYTLKKGILHSYATLCDLLVRIGNLALHEKRVRQTTYSRIESYLEEILQLGKT